MPDSEQYVAIRKISTLAGSIQRIQDRVASARAVSVVEPTADAKLDDANTALEDAQNLCVEALTIQAAAS